MIIRPLALYLGWRYTRAKRRNHFISFISLASMIGIALGVTVLITVLSVMNGFDFIIKSRFFAMAPQVTILTNVNNPFDWQTMQKEVEKLPGIDQAAPYVNGNSMIVSQGEISGISVQGILPDQEPKVSQLAASIVDGSLASLQPGRFNVVIGRELANRLALSVGDKITLLTPEVSDTPLGTLPRYKRLTISGIFHTSSGFGFDTSQVFVAMQDAQKLFSGGQALTGLHVKLDDLYQAEKISLKLQQLLPSTFAVTNWTRQYGAFFKALVMEKTMIFIILLFIIAVAAFNLVSTLVMVVNDKRADIAILRTLGAKPRTIMSAFVVQGAIVGLIGTLLGLIGGISLALSVTDIVNWIQKVFNVHFISSSIYFVDYLPSRLQLNDVITVSSIAFVLSLLATLYPAWLAFRTQPAEALRYE